MLAHTPAISTSPAKTVSTIIPTFNRSKVVTAAIKSALAQQSVDQEIIVIDDGSTDATWQLLQREFGDAIQVVHQENAGVSAARNEGLRRATGEFIAFLDSDDRWHPGKLARQVDFLQAHPDYGMVITDMDVVDSGGNVLRTEHRRAAIPEDGKVLDHVLRYPAMTPSTAMLRAEVYRRVGGFDTSLKTAEDIDLFLRIAHWYEIGLIEESLTYYSSGHDSLSAPHAAFDDYAYVVERFVRTCGAGLRSQQKASALFAAYDRCATGLAWAGDLRGALRFGLKASRCASAPEQWRALGLVAGRLLWYGLRALRGAQAVTSAL